VAARDEMSKSAEKQELKGGIDGHAICTITGAVRRRRSFADSGRGRVTSNTCRLFKVHNEKQYS